MDETTVNETVCYTIVKEPVVNKSETNDKLSKLRQIDSESLSVTQMLKNVIRTRLELRNKKNANLKRVVSKIVKRPLRNVNNVTNNTQKFVVVVNLNVKLSK